MRGAPAGRGAGPPLQPLDEDGLTARFRALAGGDDALLQVGIGDDAAVLTPPADGDLVWTVDTLEEDVDFRRAWLTLEELGARAVRVTLSDLAAMAARPLAVLLSLGSAATAPAAELLEIFRGATADAHRFGARVAGGDLTRRKSGVGITVTALGAVSAGRALRRSGARPGDEIWVTGRIGLAARGLALLDARGRAAAEREDGPAVLRWLRPEPRLAEAAWLVERVEPTAAIDLSDGIARDLGRLCSASAVGARVEIATLREAAQGRGVDDRKILTGGEDFEILLAAPPGSVAAAAEGFTRTFDVPITRVGTVVTGDGVTLLSPDGDERLLAPEGWDHVRPANDGA